MLLNKGNRIIHISRFLRNVGPASTESKIFMNSRRKSNNESLNFAEYQIQYQTTARSKERNYFFLLSGIIGAAAFGSYWYITHKQPKCKEVKPDSETVFFSADEISNHKDKSTGIWVTYQNRVYDITEFVDGHPGGSSKIMLAAGGALEPYWAMYAIHKKQEVLEILDEYKIGEIRVEDRVVNKVQKDGPFSKEPERHPALIINSDQPFNGETPPELAIHDLITPNELFFVRNHLPVPTVDENDFQLEICNENTKSIKLSLQDLKTKFKKHKVIATLQCAGNRRSQFNDVKKVKGLNWTKTAIGNAEWEGALLRDVLMHAGIDPNDSKIQHIQFEGLDKDPTQAPYGASIPVHKVVDASGDVILAYSMNGKPIPRDHGFPLRVVAPGIVGARNVKWLCKVIASKDESSSHWQQNDYKGFSPNVDWDNVDFKSSQAIQELPVTSAICIPKDGTTIDESDEDIVVSGYAYSGGGRGILRVDVSVDGGKTWHTANLKQAKQPPHRMWSWTIWTADVPIPKSHDGMLDICCKAVDNSYNTQPESVAPIWNLRGVLNNAWHRVTVGVIPDDSD